MNVAHGFTPADSQSEAIQRIYALTGRADDGSRGEKRALVALRDALDLDVDTVRTNSVLGRSLATALHVEWIPAEHTERNKVTLAGLNSLLRGATVARRNGSLRRLLDEVPDALRGAEWARYRPARSKIEAVTRIAALTGAPREWLGPGSKEHRSVLVNLADRAFAGAELDRSSKTRLAATLARTMQVPWTDSCESTGETISLNGLNIILAGAERRLGRLGEEVSDALGTPQAEGDAVAAALLAKLPQSWDAKKAVRWLADRDLRGANDNEWQGFYGEERAKDVLARSFTPRSDPPQVRYGNTVFDYALSHVWDIKVHTELQVFEGSLAAGKNETLLNDERSIRSCVAEQGLGFVVLGGRAHMDDSGHFVEWHRNFKAERSSKAAAPSNSGRSRVRKSAFDVLHVETFWVANTQALEAAILAGALKVRPIGRQAPREAGGAGASRADKFEMRMRQARQGLRVARYEWPEPR